MGALIFQRGKILLVQRGQEPLKGYWSLPGGVLETGETLREGVRREVREETGLDVEPSTIVEVFERIMRDEQGRAEYHYVLADFVCRVIGGTLRPADDASQAAWVHRDKLSQYLLTEGTLDVIERAYRRRRGLHPTGIDAPRAPSVGESDG